jgi:copper transport protein
MTARRALAVLALSGALVLAIAAPASAHADFVSSDPAAGQVLDEPPKTITLRFTESVSASGGAVKVFNTDSERVDEGAVDVSGKIVRATLPALEDGSFIVTWRVTSSDAHPIQGAFTFQVGAAGNATSREVTGLADRLLASDKSDQAVGIAYGVTRWLVFASIAVLIGAVTFLVVVHPAARASKGARRLVWGGFAGLVVGTVAGLLVYGPYAASLGLGDVFSTSVIGETLETRFGKVWAIRLGLLALAVPLLVSLLARDGDAPRPLHRWWTTLAPPLGVLVAATPGLSGHAATGDWSTAAIVSDTLHVAAMAVWLGGLLALLTLLLPGRAVAELRDAVPRWSRIALGCVIVLVATGAFQSWRQVSFDLGALRSTDFGRILIVKLVLFAVILVLAALSREVVLRVWGPPAGTAGRVPVVAGGADDVRDDDATELRRLRTSVWGEVAIAVAVLIATALLVNAPPAKAVAGLEAGGAVGVTLKSDQVWVDITVAPGVAGRNDVHVSTLEPEGAPLEVEELTVTFALPDEKIAKIDVPLRPLSPGHYVSPGFDLPIDGDWRVTAKPRLSEFEQPTLRGEIPISEP